MDGEVSTHMPLARHDFLVVFLNFILVFLLTCLLRGMTITGNQIDVVNLVSTHMPLARHDVAVPVMRDAYQVSTHMPLARHDYKHENVCRNLGVSTHMPLARHDKIPLSFRFTFSRFYSHASCEA